MLLDEDGLEAGGKAAPPRAADRLLYCGIGLQQV